MAAYKVQKVYFDSPVVSPWEEVVRSMAERDDNTRKVALQVDWPWLKVSCEVPESDSHDGYVIDVAYNIQNVTRVDPPDNRKPLPPRKKA